MYSKHIHRRKQAITGADSIFWTVVGQDGGGVFVLIHFFRKKFWIECGRANCDEHNLKGKMVTSMSECL